MKRIFNLVAMIAICNIAFSQTPASYRFRKPVVVNSTTWKFLNVTSGVDALVSVTGSQNATVNMIDDSSIYAYAWQPNIKYTAKRNNSSDSSYVEFTINFVKTSNGTTSPQSVLAMTIVDCDGNSNFREMAKVSLPATAKGISGSLITSYQDSKWLNFIGGTTDMSGVDTSVYKAMSQVNFTNIATYKIRVGVLGKINANETRQASYYFKGFTQLIVPLPVKLVKFTANNQANNNELTWLTSSEENLSQFDVMRSLDGKNFELLGSVNAVGNSNDLNQYNYTDFNASELNSTNVFYQLRMADENGDYKFSSIVQVKNVNSKVNATISIYPNPSADFVNINFTENEPEITILDGNGKTIELTSTNNNVIGSKQYDIRTLVNGVYFVNILNNDGSVTSTKFIKR